MPEKNPKAGHNHMKLGGAVTGLGMAGALYESLQGETVYAVGAGAVAISGLALIYKGIRKAAGEFVRSHHEELQYDRTHETLDD